MSNSLLNYFKKVDNKTPLKSENSDKSKTPITDKKKEEARKVLTRDLEDKENDSVKSEKMEMDEDDDEIKAPRSRAAKSAKSKRSIQDKDSEDEAPKNVKSKRRRLMIASDSEYSASENEKESSESDIPSGSEDEEMEEDVKPKSKPVIKNKNLKLGAVSSPRTPKTEAKVPVVSSATKSALSSFSANTDNDNSSVPFDGKFKHMTYAFLEEDKIKDINGRLKSDPNYDPRTIYVPPEFKKSLTPALRQWWELKSTNFDVIFFFKVGKFYELYHQDAMIAVKELGLTFMKGDYAHCGFPEISYSRFADALVSKGYKVGRVEQTETPEMMTERVKGTRQDKTVRREICRITTPGTKTFNVLDSDVSNAFSQYLFSFVENVKTVQDKLVRLYGVCFVDTTVGKIFVGQFEDDRNCSKFRTTLAHYPPAHILYDKSSVTKETKNIIELQNGIKEALSQEKEMISAATLLRTLSEGDYFKENGVFGWPENFKTLLSEQDTLGLTAKSDYEYAVNAMGGIFWCLRNCLIDTEIFSMKNFEIYQPVDNTITHDIKDNQVKKTFMKQKYMVLDSISLYNLEIFENNYDSTQAGTLYEQLDFCNTQFGKRLLKYWIVNPLCDPDAINDRLDAIEDLKKLSNQLSTMTEALKNLPDLERLISKIHQLGNLKKDHPESRAIMYENLTYSKKKVEDFITILNGFSNASKLLNNLKDHCPKLKSNLLRSILTINKKDDESNKKLSFPYLDELLKFYNQSFDAEKAKKDGKIIPSPGVNEDYDTAISDIKSVEKKLESYLKSKSRELGCQISFFGTNKNRYQLEIPETKCKNLPEDFELTSSKKGFKRYWTIEIREFISELTDAEDRREQALRDTMRCLFKNFDNHYKTWNRAVQCLSILDVLISLTSYYMNSEFEMCRPEIVVLENNDMTPFLDIKNGRHPCLLKTFSGDFIPNDIVIGCKDSNNNWQRNPLMLVTGPNMGGKSTLMRQAGLTVVLAQMGSFVPAESCRLSPVDRIFTRIGASDKILAGESTFFLELSETSSILHHATKHSLVLMDELGRGTATFDGTAIAYSVVKELAQKINCRSLFSTHYHHLVEEFSNKENVSMGHMQSMVSDDDQTITFLYKFGEGACPKSHGFNAARLADIPDDIIKLGSQKSNEFENFTKKIQFLKKIMQMKSKKDIGDVIEKFKLLKN